MTLRILVASDLHANVDRSPNRNDTYILTEPPVARRSLHPLADLERWLAQEGETFDYLIVPGDIANQDDSAGLAYAWDRLSQIATRVGAKLIGAPGNHDVTTHEPVSDRQANLKALTPSFPTLNPTRDARFWSDGWLLLDDEPGHSILILDSTANFPPYPTGASKRSRAYKDYLVELDRGSFSEAVEEALEDAFDAAPEKLNIAVVHHHPIEHQNVSHLRDTYGAMNRGGDLIDLLSRHPHMGRWIVIHGHKHIPQLVNSVSATANGPLVLCAASLGHKLWDPITTDVRNQFHILEATNSPASGLSTIRGKVRSYYWGYAKGWQESPPEGCGLPWHSGFGCTDDPRTLGNQIISLMDDPSAPLDLIKIQDLHERFPQINFQLPSDAKLLREYLALNGFEFTEYRRREVELGRST